MKILIAYSSLTGNTEKLCNAVYENIKDKYDVTIKPLKNVKDYIDYDAIVPGFWVDKGTADKKSIKFICKIKDKTVLPIGTLGADPKSFHGEKCLKNVSALVDESNKCQGVFLSRGKVDPKLIKRMKYLPLPKEIRDKMYQSSITSREPNETDFKNATEFVIQGLSE